MNKSFSQGLNLSLSSDVKLVAWKTCSYFAIVWFCIFLPRCHRTETMTMLQKAHNHSVKLSSHKKKVSFFKVSDDQCRNEVYYL